MENNLQNLIDYIKSVIQACEDADRKTLAEAKENYLCTMKEGFASSFRFNYSSGNVEGNFEYYDTGLGLFDEFIYESKDLPISVPSFPTKEVYKNEVVPALTSWLEEKVQNEPFGGLYRADFRFEMSYVDDSICVSDPKRKELQREMIRSLVQNKIYETMYVESDEYEPVIQDIMQTIPTFFGELPTEILKDAIATICEKYKKADSWYYTNAVQYPLASACNKILLKKGLSEYGFENRVVTDEYIPDEQLDFLCWIALQIIRYADESHIRDKGEEILNYISQKGYKKAKEYLKFGTGNIDKKHTHLKTKKFEAIANDINRLITFKVKEEDAESYGGMLDYIINLLNEGFPADYQIKINSKLKNYIPVSEINKKSKTNLFFGNAATFPELWDKMAEYVRTIFNEFTYYSDANEEEAVTVGGYAVYALAIADLKANREIVDEFLDNVDFEHDVTVRSFVEEHMDEETIKKYHLNL